MMGCMDLPHACVGDVTRACALPSPLEHLPEHHVIVHNAMEAVIKDLQEQLEAKAQDSMPPPPFSMGFLRDLVSGQPAISRCHNMALALAQTHQTDAPKGALPQLQNICARHLGFLCCPGLSGQGSHSASRKVECLAFRIQYRQAMTLVALPLTMRISLIPRVTSLASDAVSCA